VGKRRFIFIDANSAALEQIPRLSILSSVQADGESAPLPAPKVFPTLTRMARKNGAKAPAKAYNDFMRPRCVELACLLKKTGSSYYHRDW
jgi:hypothetical protein